MRNITAIIAKADVLREDGSILTEDACRKMAEQMGTSPYIRYDEEMKAVVYDGPEAGNEEQIELYVHCKLCEDERPPHISPKDWQEISAGWTGAGFQVWCDRHGCNVIHINFLGQKVMENMTRKP